jgi:hypothetical protein
VTPRFRKNMANSPSHKDCGSSLYTELEVMPDSTCVKAGGLDGGKADIPINVEFYTKDRPGFSMALKDAKQVEMFG